MGERDDEIRERYRRDGYVVRDVLPMDEVEALRAEIAAVCRGERGEVEGLKPLPADTPDAEAVASVLNINHPHKISSFIAERMAHPRIVEALRRIIGPNVKCINCVIFNRHAHDLGMSWHQDEYYIPTRDRSLAQVWIALEDTTRERACLRVIPGSHTTGILWPTRENTDPDHFNRGVDETYGFPYTDDDAVNLKIAAGSAIFFNGYLLHGSAPYQAKTGSRRAIAFGYMSAESLFPWDWNGMLEKTTTTATLPWSAAPILTLTRARKTWSTPGSIRVTKRAPRPAPRGRRAPGEGRPRPPLRRLENRWVFCAHGDTQCMIEFDVDFEFRSRVLQALIGVLFHEASRRMVGAFEARARALYGER